MSFPPPSGRAFAPLSALAALVVLSGCGGETTSTATVTATASAESTASVSSSTVSTVSPPSTTTSTVEGSPPPADQQVTKLTGFTSPTGNIGCYIDRRNLRCDIDQRDWEPPPAPSSCQLDFGQGISLDAGGAPAFVCAGDTALGGGPPLPYGQSIAAGLLRCESEESGMTCTDTETGRGFTLSKESYSFR